MCYIFFMAAWQKQKENRCFPRVNFHSKIRYQFRGKPDFDCCVSKDISYGGLRITNEQFMPVSRLVMLEINVLNRILRPIGKVAWSMPLAHSNRNQTGIEFVEFNSAEQSYLKDFINMQNR
ncbi:MAG: PilZ domain-containing protein [Candidatus Omnitrophota bacterium]|nr:PilZ domain-containing protein [Candidatus Omnitrophota bacterium]